MDLHEETSRALAITGAADFSSDGIQGRMEINGALADAIVDALGLSPSFTAPLRDKPVRLSRFATLELWIDGWYTEGPGVRRIVHEAACRMKG